MATSLLPGLGRYASPDEGEWTKGPLISVEKLGLQRDDKHERARPVYVTGRWPVAVLSSHLLQPFKANFHRPGVSLRVAI